MVQRPSYQLLDRMPEHVAASEIGAELLDVVVAERRTVDEGAGEQVPAAKLIRVEAPLAGWRHEGTVAADILHAKPADVA